RDSDFAEATDRFTITEFLNYEDLGFCGRGEGGHFVEEGRASLGGEKPVNVSGGLKSYGHPVGATGVRMIYELATQLRGRAGDRQGKNARIGLAHTLGGPGAAAAAAARARARACRSSRTSSSRSAVAENEPPAERDLGREPVGERVGLRVDHHAPPGIEATHVGVGEDPDPTRDAHLLLLGRQRVAGEEVGCRPFTAARAEDEDEVGARMRIPDAGDHVFGLRRRLDAHYAPNNAPYQNFEARLSTWSTCTCFTSVYSRMPSSPNSRPMPLCL